MKPSFSVLISLTNICFFCSIWQVFWRTAHIFLCLQFHLVGYAFLITCFYFQSIWGCILGLDYFIIQCVGSCTSSRTVIFCWACHHEINWSIWKLKNFSTAIWFLHCLYFIPRCLFRYAGIIHFFLLSKIRKVIHRFLLNLCFLDSFFDKIRKE